MQIDIERRIGQMKRATVARSALDVIALIFLGCSFVFWSVAFFQLLSPPVIASLLTLQAAVLASVYALAAPLLLSALVPTTPAGQLLQKTQLRTVGFAAVVAAAFFLTYQGNQTIELWLVNQPGVAEAGMARTLAISLSIAFVLIPALAWTQLTPERWLAQIQQAHQVRKLEIMHSGEIAIIKSRLLWAEQRAAVSYANLLPGEQAEVRDTLRGLLMGIADTQRGIAHTLGISAELERTFPTLDDMTIAESMERVGALLEVPARALDDVLMASYEEEEAPRRPPPSHAQREALADAAIAIQHPDAAPAIPASPSRPAAGPAPQRPAAPRSAPQRYAVEYAGARDALAETKVWSVRQLAEALSLHERTARDRLNAWMERGLVKAAETKGLFYFTEWSEQP